MDQIEGKLLSKNIIRIPDEINGKVVVYIEEALNELYTRDSPGITVLISSGGGSVVSGLNIYDLLRLYPGKKTGLVVCAAFSMAAVILQACDERFATTHARILVHNIKSEIKLDDMRDEEKFKDFITRMEDQQLMKYLIVSKRSGKSLEEVREKFAEDKPIYSEKALAFGLIDGIWDKPLPK